MHHQRGGMRQRHQRPRQQRHARKRHFRNAAAGADMDRHRQLRRSLPLQRQRPAGRYHLVGVGNNKTYSFYINGVLQQSQLAANMGSLSSDSHTIGTMFDNGGQYYNHYLNGSVDEMRIYSRALSATEILALYNGGSFP